MALDAIAKGWERSLILTGVTRVDRTHLVQWMRGLPPAWLRRVPLAATIFAVLGFAGSLSPSLLPRSGLFQGVVTGLSTAAWYGFGTLVDRGGLRLARALGVRVEVKAAVRIWALRLLVIALIALVTLAPFIALNQQQDLARAFDKPEPGFTHGLISGTVGVATFALIIGIRQALAWLFNLVLRRLHRLPNMLAGFLASATVVIVVLGVIQWVLLGGVMRVVGGQQAEANAGTPKGVTQPQEATLSGSPASAESWESLGYEGRHFVGIVPTAQRIAEVTGRPAKEPIRAYAGIGEDGGIDNAVERAIAELDRTDAWSRGSLVIFTTTGLGWVNRWSVQSAEYLTGGDVASVAVQHSTLPSALALLDAPSNPREAGEKLTAAVLERVEALPARERPKVYVSGESLGAYGGEAAFSSMSEMLQRVDGGVWTGPPAFTQIHAEVTRDRQGGSTEVNPVVDNGRHVRFADTVAELTADQYGRALGPWDAPRIAYLQHRSDPVVWFHPALIFSEPDWLREDHSDTTTAGMTWLPVITFWQVTADLAMSTSVPTGYGHNYRDEVVPTWAGVLGGDPTADYQPIIDAIRYG